MPSPLPNAAPRASASMSATVLHLLLATHLELDELPITWQIELDHTIRPFIAVDHPDAERATRLLGAALELDVDVSTYTAAAGHLSQCLRVEGRWGGATWCMVTYARLSDAPGGEQP
jgi:hypothetical protein